MLRKRIGYERIRRVVCKGAQFEWYRELMARLKTRRAIFLRTPRSHSDQAKREKRALTVIMNYTHTHTHTHKGHR